MLGNNLKKTPLKLTELATPIILSVYLIIALILVYSSGNFLKKQFDKIIRVLGQDNSAVSMTTLDFISYQAVAKKINLPQTVVPTSTSPIIQSTSTQPIPFVTTSTATSTSIAVNSQVGTTTTIAFAKELNIKIYNTTKISGVAGKLKNILAAAGFKNISSGNLPPIKPNTILRVKPSLANDSQISEIKNLVANKYQVTDEPLIESDNYDVIILIGAN